MSRALESVSRRLMHRREWRELTVSGRQIHAKNPGN